MLGVELVDGNRVCVDVWCILYYTYSILYIITLLLYIVYYTIYYILYYTILFSSSVYTPLFLFFCSLLLFCLYIILYLIFCLYSSLLILLFSSPLLFILLDHPHPNLSSSSSSVLFLSNHLPSPISSHLPSLFPNLFSSFLLLIPTSSSIHQNPTIPIFILYLSVLGYGYLYSPIFPDNLTPHVLSEWMVEV